MKNLIFLIKKVYHFIRCLFIFNTPKQQEFHFVDLVVKNNSFFLFTWSFSNLKYIEIKEANFISYVSSGSAYIKIPKEINEISFILANNWKSISKNIILKKTNFDSLIDFKPKLNNTIFENIEFEIDNLLSKTSKTIIIQNHTSINNLNISINHQNLIYDI